MDRKETRRDKFIRMAEDRVNRTMHLFQLIRNLTMWNNYEITPEDVDKIIAQIDKVWKETKVFMKRDGLYRRNKVFELKDKQ